MGIRSIRMPDEIDGWLELRAAAFPGPTPSARPWTADDFRREFLAQPWWSPERMWVAIAGPSSSAGRGPQIVGSVTLGRSGRPPNDRAAVLWLMVRPEFRRRGIGRALLATLERAAWDLGERELTLETHADWREAVRLYQRCGYVPGERQA